MTHARPIAIVLALATSACFLEIVEKPGEELGDSGESDDTGDSSDTDDSLATCGNTVREGAEQCDGQDLDGQDCVELGFMGGTLACSPACAFDTSDCKQPTCGDGVKERDEECDGEDFAGRTCELLGFAGGMLMCTAECIVDTSGCTEN